MMAAAGEAAASATMLPSDSDAPGENGLWLEGGVRVSDQELKCVICGEKGGGVGVAT